MRIPTRLEVRELAGDNLKESTAAAVRGRNFHQVIIDQREKLNRYAALLSEAHGEDVAAGFLLMYSEEMEAASAFAQHQMDMQAAAAPPARPAGAADWQNQSLGEQIARGLIGGLILITVMGLCMGSP